MFNLLPQVLMQISSLLILSLGVILVMDGKLSLGMLIAFQSFLSQFMRPLFTLVASWEQLGTMSTSVGRIEDIMTYPTDPLAGQDAIKGPLVKLKGELEFKNVEFGYSRLQEPLIKNLNFKVPGGHMVAIVGRSGSGKSTLDKLALGLYQPWKGEVLLDGKPRTGYPRATLAGSIAAVDQDIKMFPGTLLANLKLWDPMVSDTDVMNACKTVMVHDEIMHRDGGYRCQVDEGGKNFSGGQLERFEIARALAMKPSILFLDEATKALDADTELEIMRNIRSLGITVVVISHRYAAIKDADEILVVDQGEVVERGTHESLFAKGGLYSKLVMME